MIYEKFTPVFMLKNFQVFHFSEILNLEALQIKKKIR